MLADIYHCINFWLWYGELFGLAYLVVPHDAKCPPWRPQKRHSSCDAAKAEHEQPKPQHLTQEVAEGLSPPSTCWQPLSKPQMSNEPKSS